MIKAPLRESDLVASVPAAAVTVFGPDQFAEQSQKIELAQEVSWVVTLLLSDTMQICQFTAGLRCIAAESWHSLVSNLAEVQDRIIAKAKAMDESGTAQLRQHLLDCAQGSQLSPEVAEDKRAEICLLH